MSVAMFFEPRPPSMVIDHVCRHVRGIVRWVGAGVGMADARGRGGHTGARCVPATHLGTQVLQLRPESGEQEGVSRQRLQVSNIRKQMTICRLLLDGGGARAGEAEIDCGYISINSDGIDCGYISMNSNEIDCGYISIFIATRMPRHRRP